MTGFSSDNISSLTNNIKTSAAGALQHIQMSGFDPNNIPSEITNAVNSGVNQGQSSNGSF